MAPRLVAGWMLGVVPGGLVLVGPRTEIDVRVDATAEVTRAVAAALADGRPAVPGVPRAELRRLRGLLAETGALGEADGAPPGHPLTAALASARAGRPASGVIWTAEEALIVPDALPDAARARAIEAFATGLRPDGRLLAYRLAAAGGGAVHGDAPDRSALEAALSRADAEPADVAAVEIGGAGRTWRVPGGDLDAIGADEPHRLGPILRTWEAEPLDGELYLCVAETSTARLAHAAPARERRVQGVGDPRRARLVAHAEGAERYAVTAPSPREGLTRARVGDLPGAIEPRALYDDGASENTVPEESRLWAPATGADGAPHWVPAEVVRLGAATGGPGELPWTTSGVAAHTDPQAARERALWELIERDAFMWTWLGRVSRERIDPAGPPAQAARLARRAARDGWVTTWVNLSLDLLPVVLCCVTHDEAGMVVGAACSPRPSDALERATVEAIVLALRFRPDAPAPRPEDVRTPRDHLLLHRDPARRPDHGFLIDSPREVALDEIPGAEGEDVAALLAAAGHPPLFADLTLPACRPYHVIRALAPGLLPLTFGWGREPKGMPRAACALPTRDGRLVDPGMAAADRAILPHPFP